MKNILVLGSSGQIGSYLCSHLESLSYDVSRYDIAENPWNDLRRIGDANIDYAIRNSDFIFFLAFDVGGSRYLNKYQNTFNFIDNNSRMMVAAFDRIKIHQKPFIFASSQMSNMSYSNYGVLKALGEAYTKSLGGLIVKFWNVYGYETVPEKYHAITDFIIKAKSGVIDMMTDGEEERDFLYADDCCEALHMTMNNYEKFNSNDDLHITSFKWTKVIHIANIIAGHYNASVLKGKGTDIQQNKRNEPSKFILDYWTPKTDIISGIEMVIEKMESNKSSKKSK